MYPPPPENTKKDLCTEKLRFTTILSVVCSYSSWDGCSALVERLRKQQVVLAV